MTDFKTLLLKLNKNLSTLREREAKSGGNAPPDLLNQIADHQEAIALTEQARQGEMTESEWRQALQPLLAAIEARTDEASSSVTIGDIGGGLESSNIAGRDVNQVTINVVNLMEQFVAGQEQGPDVKAIIDLALAQIKAIDPRTAQRFPQNPAGYEMLAFLVHPRRIRVVCGPFPGGLRDLCGALTRGAPGLYRICSAAIVPAECGWSAEDLPGLCSAYSGDPPGICGGLSRVWSPVPIEPVATGLTAAGWGSFVEVLPEI